MIHPKCNPLCCKAYSCGWCEYDFWMDKLYPADPALCPILNEREEDD